MTTLTCDKDCACWVKELTFAGCSTGGSFPAHCPYVIDRNDWHPINPLTKKKCAHFQEATWAKSA